MKALRGFVTVCSCLLLCGSATVTAAGPAPGPDLKPLVDAVCAWSSSAGARPRIVLAGGADRRTTLDAMIAEDVSVALVHAGCVDVVERSQLEHLWTARGAEASGSFDSNAVRSFSSNLGAQALLVWTRSETGGYVRLMWKLLDASTGNIVTAGIVPVPRGLLSAVGGAGGSPASAIQLSVAWPVGQRIQAPWGTWRSLAAPIPEREESLGWWPVWGPLSRSSRLVFRAAIVGGGAVAGGSLLLAGGGLLPFGFASDYRQETLYLGGTQRECRKPNDYSPKLTKIAGTLRFFSDRIELSVKTDEVESEQRWSVECTISVPYPAGQNAVGVLLNGEHWIRDWGAGVSAIEVQEGGAE